MTAYVEDPADYIGTHRYSATPVTELCGKDGCLAFVSSDESHRDGVHGDEYNGRHRWQVRRNGGWNVRRRSLYGGAR